MRSLATTLVCVLAVLTAPIPARGASTHHSSRIKEALTIDGDTHDWKGIPFKVFRKKRIALAIANDEQYLFVSVRFKDPLWLRSFARHGVTLWPSAKGQKRREHGLRYYFQLPAEVKAALRAKGHALRQEQPIPEVGGGDMPIEERIELVGEPETPGTILPIDGGAGPSGSMHFEQGLYTCEFRVPLAAAPDTAFSIPASTEDSIRLIISFGGEKLKAKEPDAEERRRKQRMENGRSSMYSRSPLDSRRSRMESRGDSTRVNTAHPKPLNPALGEEIWIKIQLAD